MPQQIGGHTEQMVALPFIKTDFADANGTLNTPQATSLEYVMPAAGSIIGITGALNAALSTGTLTFQATINGSLSPVWPDAASLRTNQQRAYYMQDANKANFVFAAGQRVGVHVNASDTISATTTDGAFLVFVLLDNVRY